MQTCVERVNGVGLSLKGFFQIFQLGRLDEVRIEPRLLRLAPVLRPEPDNGAISRIPGESELVLPANTRLYVQKVTTAPSTRGRGDADGFGSESALTHIVHAVILPTH
jgi:hypothetical protein